jgi:RNA polymerase sigma-70 factor (ECF subfamily)
MEQARSACAVLYQRHARFVLAFLSRRLPRSELEDAAQTVWERVWRGLPGGFSGGNFRAWIFQIARNLLIDLGRKRSAVTLDEPSAIADPSAAESDAALLDRERLEVLRRCIEGLDSATGQVVRGRLKGEAYEAICRQTGLDAARAQKLLHTAKQRLRACVEEHLR